jgi:AcrR family transcriptional regulator
VAVSEPRVKARRTRSATRRQELVDVTLALFGSRGVAVTSVDDIVRAAGVAKGTFYLYFATKDDIVNAVAERLVMQVGDRFASRASNAQLSPINRLLALGQMLTEVGKERHEHDLMEVFHRPENRAVHDRLAERIVTQLAPPLASIIREGIDADLFLPQDPRLSASFVLGTFTSLHHVVSDPTDMPAAMAHLDRFILRGLGYQGDLLP